MSKLKQLLNTRRIAVLIFLFLVISLTYINLRGNFLEYKELGERYISIFSTNIKYEYSVIIINFILLYLIMYLTGRGIKKGLNVFFCEEKKEVPKLPNKSISLVTASIASIATTKAVAHNIILFASNASFNVTDKLFNLDISFFMFTEPLIKMCILYLGIILIAMTLYSIIYYIVVFNRYFDGIDKESFKKSMLMNKIYRNIKLISIVIALYTLVSCLDIVFDVFLTTDNGIKLVGAGFIDSTIKLWGYVIFSILIVIATYRAVNNVKKGIQGKIFKNLSIIPIYLVALFLVIMIFDFIFVRPNKFDKEKQYIEANIEYTKKAYGIDIESSNLEYSGTITNQEVENNQNIIKNAVIVDKEMVLDNLNYSQTGAGYYKYSTAGITKNIINEDLELLYVSPREIVSNKRTYNSKTYEYTHGYGAILTSATDFTENGAIKYIQNDISRKDEYIKISTPQIYYGLETNYTVITNGKDVSEYDYTSEGKEYENSYNGTSGLKLNFLDRLILGIKKGDVNLAFSNKITSESKILINRNIIKRAQKLLSNVIYDTSPYTVIDENGNLYWVIDAYTTSDKYPYSTYTNVEYDNQRMEINYIRNSIKVIVNSYNGEIRFYITDRTDPIAMAYRNIYKDLFQDLDEKIPESISKQFVYPKFLYDVQASKLEEYHNKKADVLYRSDDTWEKAIFSTGTSNKLTKSILDSYYTLVKSQNEEIGLIQMFMPKGKQTITSYLVGTWENGRNILTLKTLTGDSNIIGPMQLDNQVSQNEEIQKEIDGLMSSGFKVTKNMIIIPIENTLLYIEPIYQTAINESNIPLLKKVIVASGNKVAIGDTFEKSLENLLSQSEANIEIENLEDIDGLIEAIIKANNNLTSSLEANNWELIGSDVKKLQDLIKEMEKEQINKKQNEKEENIINTNEIVEDLTKTNIID